MPVYTYRCQECGVKFTKKETLLAKPLKRCAECHHGIVRRVPQLPTVIFKGSGWYSTDHRPPSGQTSTPGRKYDKAERFLVEKSES